MRQSEIETAIDACYEAVTAPEMWSDALDRLATSVDASCAMLYPKDVAGAAISLPSSPRYKPFLDEYVANKWYEGHYRAERGWPLMARGLTVIEHDLASDEERKRIPVYNDLYLKHGYPGFAGVGFRFGNQVWCVPFLRSRRQGFFSREDARRLARLGPHLRRIVSLTERFETSRLAGGMAALEKAGIAAVLIDGLGRIEQMTPTAAALIAGSTAVRLRGGYLHASDPASDRALAGLIRRAIDPAAGTARGRELQPAVVDQDGRLPLLFEAVSVSGIVTALSVRARALLFIKDLDRRVVPREERLMALFGLSAAEARLAVALSATENLRRAAEARGVTYETARVQLKSVFDKTGVRCQSELLALIARMGCRLEC